MKNGKKPNLDLIVRFLNFWDPMEMVEDLVSAKLVPDEYDIYAGRILALLEKGTPVTVLIEELKTIQVQEMDRPFDYEKASLIAEALVHLFQNENHRFYF